MRRYGFPLAALALAVGDLPRLRVVDLLEHDFDHARFNQRPFKDHASPYGNEVIAAVLAPVVRAALAPRRPRSSG